MTRTAGDLNSLGIRALKDGEFATAERHFLSAIERDELAPELWMNLATARRRLGHDEGERDALTRALSFDQRHIGANVRLAELHERLGEVGSAIYRWSGLLELARQFEQVDPSFLAILDHARQYVSESGDKLSAKLDDELADARSSLSKQQSRRFDACVDAMLGRRRIYHNECHGLHFPFLPADEFFDRQHFPWLAQLEEHFGSIRSEAEAILRDGVKGIEPYVQMEEGSPHTKWSPLDKSFDWSVFYLWRFGVRDDAHCQRCPQTAAALEQIVPLAEMSGRTPNVFFSILKPHTRLPAHTGVSNARAIVHLPLIVPEGCGFRVGGETREWREGEAFAFDDTIDHEAWNDSDQPRVVLIFDVWNPHLTEVEQRLLARYFEVADASGFDPGGQARVAD